MNIDDLTLGEIKGLQSILGNNNTPAQGSTTADISPYEIGKKYLIRTVTMTEVGTLKAVFKNELVLENASWIPNTGNFSDALRTGDLERVEPFFGDIIVGRGAVIDCAEWKHDLPNKVE